MAEPLYKEIKGSSGLEVLFEEKPVNPMRMLDLKKRQVYAIRKFISKAKLAGEKAGPHKGPKVRHDRLRFLFETLSKTNKWWLLPEVSEELKLMFNAYEGDKKFMRDMIDEYFKQGKISDRDRDMLLNSLFK